MRTYIRVTINFILLAGVLVFAGCGIEAVRLNRRAQVYIQHGQYDRASELLTKSFELDYENPASHYWLARCYEALGDVRNALWQYEIAVRFDPASNLFQMAYITTLYNNEQQDKSVEVTGLYLKHKEGAATDFIRIAESFLNAGMKRHAVLAYHAAALAEPDNPQPFLTLAEYFFAQGDKEKGVNYLVKAFKVDPVYPGLARRLGEHGLRVQIPQPKLFPKRTKVEENLFELDL